ncbi:MAG: DUF1559 domain-containing protein [Thermoguttaceae bacterium]|nr:DUF1559 domain-containing protein [Thermoguttaceae bacterium]
MKLFKLVLCLLLVIVVFWCVWFLIADREMKPVPVADVYEEVDASKGEVPDYRALYNSILEKEVFPTEENGWVDVFRALGPKSIEQSYAAERMKWEDFIADEDPTGAYQKDWKPLCEKLGIDPKEKPLFYDRLEIVPYLVKNGVRGDETPPEERDEEEIASFNEEEEEVEVEEDFLSSFHVVESYSYWEDAEERQGKISQTEANDEYIRLMSAPWTPEEHPIAAQWYAENEDMLDLIAQAARKPKFHGWHFVPDPSEGSFLGILIRDVQYVREIARKFKIRALLRVGTGDISGAIDDMETIYSFARRLLDDESCSLVERLVGVASVGMATATPLYANPNARPSAEDRARVMALFRDNSGDELATTRRDTIWRASMLHDFGAQADVVRQMGRGDTEMLSAVFCDFIESPLGKILIGITPVNEPKIHEFFRRHYRELAETPSEEREARIEELWQECRRCKRNFSEIAAVIMIKLIFPAMNAMEEACRRTDCSLRLATIAHAIWAYYDDNGTLPPAFSVDANGAPLHSWRVLILPYLGEEEKALYEQIRLDEPWNSEHNKAFYDQIPDVYRCPSYQDLPEGETIYSVLTAQDGIFDRSGTGKDPNAIFRRENRESANQLMLVERANPICWMTPDAELDLDQALNDESLDFSNFFGFKVHAGGCDVVTFGGASIFFDEARPTDPDAFRRDLFGEPAPEKEDETKEEEFLQNEM